MADQPQEDSQKRRHMRRTPNPRPSENPDREPPHPIFRQLRKIAGGKFPGDENSRVAQYLEKLLKKVTADPLTGLPTYQSFIDRLLEVTDQRLKETQRGYVPSPCTVVYCDINHFKTYNSRLGQDATDQLLKWFANTLKKELRQNRPGRTPDFIVRRSGDEFLILMPNATEEEAQKRLEEIVEKFPRKKFVVERGDRNNQYFTVSNFSVAFGCHQLDPGLEAGAVSFDTPKTAITIAEGNMNEHKHALKATQDTEPHIHPVHDNVRSLMHDPGYINLINPNLGRGR